MILNIEEIENAVERNLKRESDVTVYAIRVNGKTFVSSVGKVAWSKKGYAKMAFKATMEPHLREAVQKKLRSQGVRRIDIYSNPEYLRAFDNYMQYLESNNLFKIVELT